MFIFQNCLNELKNPVNFNENIRYLLTQMPIIIKESGEIGEFELDIFKVIISHLEEYQNNLIKI
jgi:hypothetical protein